ncbi:MAG: UvrD-helicase domain-containing protein [Tidjanibacter sp.]|nr:UvrD-helicase domain-containing protein [Tidjanibacter sp.]
MGKVNIVSASAGSGKTYRLALEYITRVLREPNLYRHILAVTFTNKATEEMKGRILGNINNLACGKEDDFMDSVLKNSGMPKAEIIKRAGEVLNKILHDYDSFAILTIDKFFQRIVRSFVRELGIDINYNLELKTDTLLDLGADRLIEDLATDQQLRDWAFAFLNENIEEGRQLDLKQKITDLGKQLFTENYRSLTIGDNARLSLVTLHRGAYAEVEKCKQNQRAIAEEVIRLLDTDGISLDMLYQGQRGMAGFLTTAIEGGFKDTNSYVKKTLNEGLWLASKYNSRYSVSDTTLLCDHIEKLTKAMRETQAATNTAALIEKHYRTYGLIIDLGKRIDKVCEEENILPISEVTNIIAELIKGNDAPFIFEKVGNRYSHFMIDEFQDTSAVQWNNFLPLLQNAISQSEDTPVLLVGDVKQSIYRWRGGDWTLLGQKAKQEFREIEASPLDDNYRSRKEIVDFNNDFIDAYKQLINNELNTMLQNGVESGFISDSWAKQYHNMVTTAYTDHCQNITTQKKGYVTATLCTHRQYHIEEHPIIKQIIDLQSRGYRASDIAILVRTNPHSERVADLLLRYKTLHPESPYTFDVITQTALKVGSADVCHRVIAAMKFAISPDDAISEAIIKQRCGYNLALPLPEAEQQFYLRLRSLPLQEAFEEIVLHYKLHLQKENHAYLQALHEQVIGYSKRRIADLALFVEWWEEHGADESITMPSGANAITVTTIHKSKGLAFGVVILDGCNWDVSTSTHFTTYVWPKLNKNNEGLSHFPVNHEKSMGYSHFAESFYEEQALAYIDNLNLLYVALTRAKYELHLIVAPLSMKAERSKINAFVRDALAKMEENGNIAPPTLLPIPELTFEDEKSQYQNAEAVEEKFYTHGSPLDFYAERAEEEERKRNEEAQKRAEGNIVESDDDNMDYSDIGFSTTLPWDKILIKFSTERYMDDGEIARLHPLNTGILLHKIFSQALTSEDIFQELELAALEGTISEEEYVMLNSRINTALTDPKIAEWFNGEWRTIRNEHQILLPVGKTNRPDRVMISEDRCVVVDYKFGRHQKESYVEQIRKYMTLLYQMGYKKTEGYIWYVTLGEVVEVKPR